MPEPPRTPQPGPGPETDAGQVAHWIVRLARLALSIFFRRVEVTGAGQVPEGRPIIFVANHVNGLIDPAMLLGFLPGSPRFLAKSTLWNIAPLRPFLRAAAAIPVYRRQDPGVDTSRNTETFARCHAVLGAAGAIALFPEGRSHNEPSVMSLKTGVSRILLEAEQKFGGLGSRIVPVGLIYDDKGRFRSRALLRVGAPLDPAAEVALYDSDPQAAVKALTARVRQAIEGVTLNYPSWEEAQLIERAAEIYERPAEELPWAKDLEGSFVVRKAFIDGYRSLQQRFPEQVASLAAAVREYDALLDLYGLQDSQVAASYPAQGVVRYLAESLSLLLVRLPLGLLGTAYNAPAYFLTDLIARRVGKTADQLATYKVLGSMFFYPLLWTAAALFTGLRWGGWVGLATWILGPVSAAVALRFHERRRHFRRHVRAFLVLHSGHRRITALRHLRQQVQAGVRALESALGR